MHWRIDRFFFKQTDNKCIPAIADYVLKTSGKPGIKPSVVIGYDTRFLSGRFAKTSAEVLAGNGIEAILCDRDTPTPVIAYEIINKKLSGGINYTASHNPFQYNGLKFSPEWGGPALPQTTGAVLGLDRSRTARGKRRRGLL